MAGFLGALEYVLEEGRATTGSATARSWPRLDLGLSVSRSSRARSWRATRSSTSARSPTAISRSARCSHSSLGIGLYGLTYLYPLYLAQIRGYNALMIGETMFVSG